MPDAKIKVYLTASVEERAHRRYSEMETLGIRIEYKQVLKELEERDSLDFKREIAPLRPAEDATEVVTDGLKVEDVVERIVSLLGKRK